MFGFKKKAAKAPVEDGPKQARDMHSFAFHIELEKGKPLCGTRNAMYGTKSVTVEGVLRSLHNQHGKSYWCAECGSAFTGEPESVFRETRFSSGE